MVKEAAQKAWRSGRCGGNARVDFKKRKISLDASTGLAQVFWYFRIKPKVQEGQRYRRYFRQKRQQVAARYGSGQNFSLSKAALGVGGLLYGVGENIITPGNQWLGLNGKYYNNSWGGNQWTGGRSSAFRASGMYKLAGRATFIGGAAISLWEGINYFSQGNYLAASKSGLDIGMGVISTYGGPIGLIAGGIYFGIDATIGWDNAFLHLDYTTRNNQAILGNSWQPMGGSSKW